MKPLIFSCLALGLSALAAGAGAQTVNFSGFGTLGYAISDSAEAYQKSISQRGTFERDSVFALQADASLNHQWSATVQVKLAPDPAAESGWRAGVSWAFLSWRPTNDWLLRAGRLRLPGYLNSESMDVGVAFDYARLPIELYSISPVYDFDGASFNKTFAWDENELLLDGYLGQVEFSAREYFRQGFPGLYAPGASYTPMVLDSAGLALTYRRGSDSYRIGLHKARSRPSSGAVVVTRPVWLSLGPDIGFYSVLPGTGAPTSDRIDFSFVNLAAEIEVQSGTWISGELGKRWSPNTDGGLNSSSAYVALRKRMGRWTPYVYHARLKSEDRFLDVYDALNRSVVPNFVPGADLINTSQRAIADFYKAFDQSTWALGFSYALTGSSVIKAEWAQTRIGRASSLVDALPGVGVNDRAIQVLSLSYSFAF